MKFLLTAVLGLVLAAAPVTAQRRVEQFYYPGKFNWSMLRNFPEAARLFNAFDYAHAVLSERLYTEPGAPVERLEQDEFRFITQDLLIRPPRFELAEEAIMPAYGKIAWRAKMMFEWTHGLHRQIYDVYADERIPVTEKPALVERLTDYYLSNRALAFTSAPKAMGLMDDQAFSQVFRRAYPKFNGLIWAYHWLQVGLYEPLLASDDPVAQKAAIKENLSRFWAMVQGAPGTMPAVMPMTVAVAPLFAERHPRAAMIFDNLHMMHDIISDVLLSEKVPHDDKAKAIEAQLDEFQRGDRNTVSVEDWRMMGHHMGGVERMGGEATAMVGTPRQKADSAGHAGHRRPPQPN
jgi:hypothetical protein